MFHNSTKSDLELGEVAAAMAIRRGIALGRKGGAIAIGNEGMIRKWRGQEGQVE